MSTRKLIKLANFLLSNYSNEPIPYPTSMWQYALWCNDNDKISEIFQKKEIQLKEISTQEWENPNCKLWKLQIDKKQQKKMVNFKEGSYNRSKKLGEYLRKKTLETEDAKESKDGLEMLSKSLNNFNEKRVLEIKMDLERNLTVFDYKILYTIHWKSKVKNNINIIDDKFEPPKKTEPKDSMFPQFRSIVNAMNHYMGPYYQTHINFRLMIIVAYINFFILLSACLIISWVNNAEWGSGVFSIAHLIMGWILIISFLLEFLLFFLAIPKDIRAKIFQSAKGDYREGKDNKWSACLVIILNSWFFIFGFIAKADLYTDITFALEAKNWGNTITFYSSLFFFFLSTSYQVYSFTRLFIHVDSKNWAYPVSEQTTILLLCSDFKFLALIMEKFSLTYYTKLFGKEVHIRKLLAFIKCFSEDVPQCLIQVYYVLTTKNPDSLAVYLSILFSVLSVIISFVSFLRATTSKLANVEMNNIQETGIVANYGNKSKKESEEKFILETKMEHFSYLSRDTTLQRMNKEYVLFQILVELDEFKNLYPNEDFPKEFEFSHTQKEFLNEEEKRVERNHTKANQQKAKPKKLKKNSEIKKREESTRLIKRFSSDRAMGPGKLKLNQLVTGSTSGLLEGLTPFTKKKHKKRKNNKVKPDMTDRDQNSDYKESQTTKMRLSSSKNSTKNHLVENKNFEDVWKTVESGEKKTIEINQVDLQTKTRHSQVENENIITPRDSIIKSKNSSKIEDAVEESKK